MSKQSSNAGFTIMELLTVLAIIGILLAIAVVSYRNVVEKAETTECMANQKTIESARTYNSIRYGSYGGDLADLAEVFEQIGFVAYGSIEELNCPTGGNYDFDNATSDITCSIERHN